MKRLAAGVLAAAGILLAGCSPAVPVDDRSPSAGGTGSGAAGVSQAPAQPAPPPPVPAASPPSSLSPASGISAAERLAAVLGNPGKPVRIALLGDSFASGEGAGSYLPVDGVADSLCHRSAEALFAGVPDSAADDGGPGSGRAAALRQPEAPVIFNLACSRAETASLGSAQQVAGHEPAGVPAQLDELAGLRPDLVLLYVGGNDLGFADLLQACLLDAEPCSSDPALHADLAANLTRLQGSLGELYREVEAAAAAPVLVLPYPRLFDPGAEDCGRLSPEELDFGLGVTDALNNVLEQSVHAAARPGVRYVEALEESFAGRGACSGDALVNTARMGALLEAAGSESASLEVLHPTAEGYRVMSADLLAWLESHPL